MDVHQRLLHHAEQGQLKIERQRLAGSHDIHGNPQAGPARKPIGESPQGLGQATLFQLRRMQHEREGPDLALGGRQGGASIVKR